jgi:hypothetical protein
MRSSQYPWVYPGDFNERLARADLIVSGTIASTVRGKARIVDGVDVTANDANMSIDRIFKGRVKSATMQFLWFSLASTSGGVIYSGPPLSDFRPKVRYLVFLRHGPSGYVVTIPSSRRNLEIAKELETAALFLPEPPPGVTGDAARYFPYVVDILGGCAEPFLRHFAGSQSKELRAAAQNWLALLVNEELHCVASR